MAYEIRYVPLAIDHLRTLPAYHRAQVLDAIDEQLGDTPELPTRNRKLLRTNALAPFELRIGDVRVFYDVERDARIVVVVAVGVKRGNTLRIGGQEIVL